MKKTTPFVKVTAQDTVEIKNVIPKILKPQNPQPHKLIVGGCAAYLAAKDYFDNLRNRIKAYDPESVIDYYDIKISDHPSRPGSSTDFNVIITTKDGHDKVGSFNVERNDPNQPIDWNNIMDALANNITSIIKYYKSAPLINENIEILKQNVDALKQRMTTTQSKTKKLEEADKTQGKIINTTTDDNVTYYPVLVENTTETNETPELDNANEELKKKVDNMSEDELVNQFDEIVTSFENIVGFNFSLLKCKTKIKLYKKDKFDIVYSKSKQEKIFDIMRDVVLNYKNLTFESFSEKVKPFLKVIY